MDELTPYEVISNRIESETPEKQKYTLADIFEYYLQPGSQLRRKFFSDIEVKPGSRKTYDVSIRNFKGWMDYYHMTEPGDDMFREYKHQLEAKYKDTSAKTYVACLKRFFRWAAINNIYRDLGANVKSVEIKEGFRKQDLSRQQVHDILETFDASTEKGSRDAAVVTLMITAGLRTCEVSRANIGDIVNKSGQEVIYIHGKGHRGKDKFERISDSTHKAIRHYLTSYRAGANKLEPLFTSTSNSTRGQQLSTRSISKIVKSAMRKAGYDDENYTAHSLRHTAITTASMSGADIDSLRLFARHRSINTTLIYKHDVDMLNNPCSDLVDEAIFGAGKDK